ncbi:VOC family protein [Saccharomonospora sp. NPDC006951]
MTTRDTPWPDGTPCWIDLVVPDQRMALDFYGALFGWDFADQGDDMGNYVLCSIDGRQVAGIGAQGQEMPPAWTVYLASSDLDKTVTAVGENGGRLMVPPMDVPRAGRMAIAADPAGAVFGVWQAGEHTGFGLANVVGADLWNECMTRDYAAAKRFYGDVFGYGFEDIEGDFTYAVLKVGGNIVGGIGEMGEETPAEVPPFWSAYFGVSDTDAAVEQVERLGGSLVRPAMDSPYGRMATVTDNQGTYFMLLSIAPEG